MRASFSPMNANLRVETFLMKMMGKSITMKNNLGNHVSDSPITLKPLMVQNYENNFLKHGIDNKHKMSSVFSSERLVEESKLSDSPYKKESMSQDFDDDNCDIYGIYGVHTMEKQQNSI